MHFLALEYVICLYFMEAVEIELKKVAGVLKISSKLSSVFYVIHQFVDVVTGSTKYQLPFFSNSVKYYFKKNTFVFSLQVCNIRGYSKPCRTCKTERFPKIVHAFQPLTIFTKRSILDV